MSTSREKLQQARELIQAKRYDEARAILRTVNHEMALDWLDKIDKLDPPKEVSRAKFPVGVVVAAFAAVVLFAGVFIVMRLRGGATQQSAPTSAAAVLQATGANAPTSTMTLRAPNITSGQSANRSWHSQG